MSWQLEINSSRCKEYFTNPRILSRISVVKAFRCSQQKPIFFLRPTSNFHRMRPFSNTLEGVTTVKNLKQFWKCKLHLITVEKFFKSCAQKSYTTSPFKIFNVHLKLTLGGLKNSKKFPNILPRYLHFHIRFEKKIDR